MSFDKIFDLTAGVYFNLDNVTDLRMKPSQYLTVTIAVLKLGSQSLTLVPHQVQVYFSLVWFCVFLD